MSIIYKPYLASVIQATSKKKKKCREVKLHPSIKGQVVSFILTVRSHFAQLSKHYNLFLLSTGIDVVAANPLITWSPETSACKRKSTLTGGGSGGYPPTVKSERRLGNRKKGRQRALRGERERESLRVFGEDLQHCCLPRFIVGGGMASPSVM